MRDTGAVMFEKRLHVQLSTSDLYCCAVTHYFKKLHAWSTQTLWSLLKVGWLQVAAPMFLLFLVYVIWQTFRWTVTELERRDSWQDTWICLNCEYKNNMYSNPLKRLRLVATPKSRMRYCPSGTSHALLRIPVFWFNRTWEEYSDVNLPPSIQQESPDTEYDSRLAFGVTSQRLPFSGREP